MPAFGGQPGVGLQKGRLDHQRIGAAHRLNQ